jgi:AraC-like DNA-binding protein
LDARVCPAESDALVMHQAVLIEGWMAQILGILLIVALLSARQNSTANRLLASGLLFSVYRQFLLTMQIAGTLANYPFLLRTSFPVQMLAVPTFYLYVNALTNPEFRFRRTHLVHFIPFAIGLTLSGHAQYIQVIVKVLVVVPYLIQAHLQVRAFELRSKGLVSDFTHLKLKWLHTLLSVVYFTVGVDALDVITGPDIPLWYLVPSVALISLMTLALFSLRVSPVFAREAQSQPPPSEQKKDSSRLPDEQLERQRERLIEELEKQELYLNPELRLSDLAAALDIRPYRVSEILNRGLQTTFYDLVNRYRISKAKELLVAPDSAHFNLLGIAMESGFKSKSVFNDACKKTTGMTPSQFRTGKLTESHHSDDWIGRAGR